MIPFADLCEYEEGFLCHDGENVLISGGVAVYNIYLYPILGSMRSLKVQGTLFLHHTVKVSMLPGPFDNQPQPAKC